MAMSLTHREAELLGFIERYQADNPGCSASFEEMKLGLDLKSKSGVHRLLDALVERGRIARIPNRARAIEILVEPPQRHPLSDYSSRELMLEVARRHSGERQAA